MKFSPERGGSLKAKKAKTGLPVVGKADCDPVKTTAPCAVDGNKGTADKARPVVKRGQRRLLDKNQLKLSRIKIAVESGLYKVDADSVAESMILSFLENMITFSAGRQGAHAGRKH